MPTQRPNILIVTSDQQRTDSLHCYGSDFVATPNFDRLAAEGTRFERAYCANPVCTPARASIFSGQYISRHGTWNTGMNVPGDVRFLSHRLAEAGYRTHNIGKAHFQSFGGTPEESMECFASPIYPAWTGPYYGFQTVELSLGHGNWGMRGHYGHWLQQQVSPDELKALHKAPPHEGRCFDGEGRDWVLPTRLHNSVWTADRTIAFLETQPRHEPFFLAVGFQDPHHPHAVPTDFDRRVDPDRVPLPAWQDSELADKPPHFLLAREGRLETSAFRGRFPVAGQGRDVDYRLVTEREARLGRAYYHTLVQLMDREFGRILDALDRLNLADNTLVIFTTDHGELLGDHGLWKKGPYLYEQLIRIPMMLRWPAAFARGVVSPSLFSQVDIAPTCLAAAGLPLPGNLDGLDAGPLLRGERASLRDSVLVECIDDPDTLRLKTIVTTDRKLTWYAGQPWGELYDLANDPGELVNRWDDPAMASEKADLLRRLLDQTEPTEALRRAPRYCYA